MFGMTARARIQEVLAKAPPGAPFTRVELERQCNCSTSSVSREVRQLLAEGKIERLGTGSHVMYRVTTQPATEPAEAESSEEAPKAEDIELLSRIIAISEKIGQLKAERDQLLRHTNG